MKDKEWMEVKRAQLLEKECNKVAGVQCINHQGQTVDRSQCYECLQALTLHWSTAKPTVAGWYWWRDLDRNEWGTDGMPVLVYQGQQVGQPGPLWVQRFFGFGDIKQVTEIGGFP